MSPASVSRLGVAAAVATALTLAGCGRKGPLELPPGAPQTQSPDQSAAQQARVLGDDDASLIQSPDKVTQATASAKLKQTEKAPPRPINASPAPRRSTFVLDPLL